MHIVHAISAPGCNETGLQQAIGGCAAVVGIMFELAEEGEETASTIELEKIFGQLKDLTTEKVRLIKDNHSHSCMHACMRGEGVSK